MRHTERLVLNRRQELILGAAIFDDERALSAWRDLRSWLDLDQLTYDEHRMVPLIYRKLSSLGVEDDLLRKLKGVYLHSWYRNALILRGMSEALRRIQGAAIPTLALKGAALIATYYTDPGVRPMNDFDVLVPRSDRDVALDVLEQLGWNEPDRRTRDIRLGYYHAIDLHGSELFGCDLHWDLMHHLTLPDHPEHSSDDFWASAEPIEIMGVPTLSLGPADQLLHVCAHGATWDSETNLTWVADAAAVIGGSGDRLDWSRLVSQARRRRSVLILRTALGSMAALGLDVPPAVRRELARSPVGRREALSQTPFVSRAKGPGAPLRSMAVDQLESYARLTANWSLRRTLTTLPAFLRSQLDLRHTWQLSGLLARRARKVWARFTGHAVRS